MSKEAPNGLLANRLRDILLNFNSEADALDYFIRASNYSPDGFKADEIQTIGATLEQYRNVARLMREAYESSAENQDHEVITVQGQEYTKATLKQYITRYTERIQKQDRIINMNTIVSYNYLNSIFDSALTDLIREMFKKNRVLIISKNNTNEEKSVSYSALLKSNSIDDLINSIIEEKVIKTSYKSIADQIKFIETNLNDVLLTEDQKKDITEKRATRNIYTHNKGVVNSIYLELVKDASFKNGDLRSIDTNYVSEAIALYKILTENFINILSRKYINPWSEE
ncbi:hypothetical protein F1C16_03085 [Hymenobacter sp. NBH84]|uniref:hypothetical protein n=1 Tax=Hymenobacter sp. NBH84 TaxID=2596915 RepID=UPI0016232280|nr:hypothetical protein [Hymenobacter sp. NBH84]QNE38608.1 hypothetical protein F1C16_03085 [Hymenobacter sp. NBH84]